MLYLYFFFFFFLHLWHLIKGNKVGFAYTLLDMTQHPDTL